MVSNTAKLGLGEVYCGITIVSFSDHFHYGGEGGNSLVNGLLHSHSTCWNVGRQMKLHCISDIILGNNGDQESLVMRLGYAGLKAASEKVVRSFANSRDVLRACQP